MSSGASHCGRFSETVTANEAARNDHYYLLTTNWHDILITFYCLCPSCDICLFLLLYLNLLLPVSVLCNLRPANCHVFTIICYYCFGFCHYLCIIYLPFAIHYSVLFCVVVFISNVFNWQFYFILYIFFPFLLLFFFLYCLLIFASIIHFLCFFSLF